MNGAVVSETAVPTIERRAPVPEAPATFEATGLTFEHLRQLLVKTLYTGEATGLGLGERMRLPYALLEQMVEHVRREKLVEVRGSSGGGSAGYRYALTDLGRDRGQQYLDVEPVHRPGARATGAVLRLRAARARHTGLPRSQRGWREGFTHLVVSAGHARPARAGGELRQVDLPLRASRQWKDRARRRRRPCARRRHVRAARDRHRRPDRHDVRSRQPRDARAAADESGPTHHQERAARSPVGPNQAARS